MPSQRLLDLAKRGFRQIAQQDILHRCEADRRTQALDQCPQRCAQTKVGFVLDAAILDADAVPPAAIALRIPAEMRMDMRHLHRPRRFERLADVARKDFAELVHAPIVYEILDASPLAIAAVAVIAE